MAIVTSYWSQDIFLITSLFLLGFYVYLTRNFNYWKNLGIKHLSPSFPFGNVGSCIFGKQSPQELAKAAYRAGRGEKLFGFYAIDRPYLLIRDPEFIKNVLIKDFNNFTDKLMTNNQYDELGSKSIFLADVALWRYLRPKLTPIFTIAKLKKMFDLMLEIGEDFQFYCDRLKIDDKIGKPIDIREICAKLTTDFIGITAFGMKLNSLTQVKAQFRDRGRSIFRGNYKRYLEMLAIFFIPALRRFFKPKMYENEGSEFLKNTFRCVIDERMKTGNIRNDLIDILIEMKENQKLENSFNHSFDLEGDTLIAQAGVFFTGGFETSSATLSFALYELAKNPKIQDKLRNEVQSVMEKEEGKLTFDLVSSLPYINMVVHETLRMYPVLAWIDRLPENDYTFFGTDMIIKKDIPFIISISGLQMDPDYFPNPETFDPERFSDENKSNIVPCTFLPFGNGPRSCIGQKLGLVQMKLGLIYFITRFEITTCKQTPLNMKFSQTNLTLTSADKLYLNFRELVKDT